MRGPGSAQNLNKCGGKHQESLVLFCTCSQIGVPRVTRCNPVGMRPSRLIANGTREAISRQAFTAATSETIMTSRRTKSPRGPNTRAAALAATKGSDGTFQMSGGNPNWLSCRH